MELIRDVIDWVGTDLGSTDLARSSRSSWSGSSASTCSGCVVGYLRVSQVGHRRAPVRTSRPCRSRPRASMRHRRAAFPTARSTACSTRSAPASARPASATSRSTARTAVQPCRAGDASCYRCGTRTGARADAAPRLTGGAGRPPRPDRPMTTSSSRHPHHRRPRGAARDRGGRARRHPRRRSRVASPATSPSSRRRCPRRRGHRRPAVACAGGGPGRPGSRSLRRPRHACDHRRSRAVVEPPRVQRRLRAPRCSASHLAPARAAPDRRPRALHRAARRGLVGFALGLDDRVDPLVPALQQPLLLTIHVGTAALAYAVAGVAFVAAARRARPAARGGRIAAPSGRRSRCARSATGPCSSPSRS